MSFNQNDLNSLFRYALSLTANTESAYDLVSHSVEKILGRPFILNKKAYAKKCIRNKYYDENKRFDNKHESLDLIQEVRGLEDLEDLTIKRDEIKNLLLALNSSERELIYLWAIEDYTLQEISKLTKTPRGTLTSKLSRIKKKLKEIRDYE